MLRTSLVAALLATLTTLAQANTEVPKTQSYPLYHRLYSFDSPQPHPAWTLRGQLHVDALTDSAWLEDSGTGVEALPTYDGVDRYQLSLGEENVPDEERRTIVVDSCILYHQPVKPLLETLILTYTPSPSHELISFRYLTDAKEVGCDVDTSKLVFGGASIKGSKAGEVEVLVDRGYTPDEVRYKKVDASNIKIGDDGKVVPPPPEQSFIQKYWMYIVPVLLVVLLGGGGEDEPAKK